MPELKDELIFFMSYAQADDSPGPPGLVRQFFGDLCREVAELVGQPERERVAYIDTQKLEPGDRWPDELSRGLARCRIFLPVLSPTYFQRPFCGKEWSFFESRLRATVPPPTILPILWQPPIEGDFPDFATERQVSFDNREIDDKQKQYLADYGNKGLKYVIRRVTSTHGAAYATITEQLAARIVRLATKHTLQPVTPPITPLTDVVQKFPPPKNIGSPVHAEASFSNRACFVFVAGLRDEMASVRSESGIFYGQHGALEWTPFAPQDPKPVGLLAQRAADPHDLIFKEIPPDGTAVEKIREAEEHLAATLVLIDPWTARLPEYEALLRDFDKQQFFNCGIIIAWNLNDHDTQAHRAELKDKMEKLLFRKGGAKDATFFRDSIVGPEELQDAMRVTLRELHAVLAKRREPKRVIQEGQFPRRPAVAATRGLRE